MKIAWNQLKHLPVQTQSGQGIGVVEGVELDTDSHAVAHYEVKPARKLLALFSRPFLIAPEQVVSITAEVMVVKENAVPVRSGTTSKKTRLAMVTPEVELSEMSD